METRDLEADSLQKLSAQTEDLASEAKSRLVFRGQARDYGSMCPRAFRFGTVPRDLARKLSLLGKFLDWFISERLPKWHMEYYGQIYYDQRNIEERRRDYHALLQHYGVPTKFVDVTYDLRIALWFATHQQRSLDGRRVTYELSDTGENTIYVFSPERHAHHIQLARNQVIAVSLERSTEKFAWYRPQRILNQKAALLQGASSNAPDLTPHILAQIRLTRLFFRDPGWKEFLQDTPLHTVFPHWEKMDPVPSADYFYGYLLACNDMWLGGVISEIAYPDRPPFRKPVGAQNTSGSLRQRPTRIHDVGHQVLDVP